MTATPNSQLQRKYQKDIKQQGFKEKVEEKSDTHLQLRDCSRRVIQSNRDNVSEDTPQCVGQM